MPTKTHNEVHSPGYDYYAKVSGGAFKWPTMDERISAAT